MDRKLVFLGNGMDCLAVPLSKAPLYFTIKAEIVSVEDMDTVHELERGLLYDIYCKLCVVADKIDVCATRVVNKEVNELNPHIGDVYMAVTKKSEDILTCYLLYLGSSSIAVGDAEGKNRLLDGSMFMLIDEEESGLGDSIDLSKLLSTNQSVNCFSFRFMLKSEINMVALCKVGKLELRGSTSVSWREADKRYYLSYRKK